ncbi:MAG: glycosyltransferase [Pyrinomonadaceae bacterium]|nr:glycosyltransferase [Phycisphaerales bacterium]
MRLLHISTRLILGGSQENTVLSCEGQARLGHEVHLAFGPIYGPEGSMLERVQVFRTPSGAGITTHILPHMEREIKPGSDRQCLGELKELIHRLTPDIIHTHSSKAGILGRVAAWQVMKGLPVATRPGILHTIHGPPFMPIEGGPLGQLKTRLKNHLYTVAERYSAKRCHLIVSVADAMTRQFLDRHIGRRDQYRTIRSGMETARFLTAAPGESRDDMRATLGLHPEDFVIGTVARLAQHKGHDDILDAVGGQLKTHPRWKLLWVGDGWWRDRLLARARQMGLGVVELDANGGSKEGIEAARDRGIKDRSGTTRPTQIILTGLVPQERVPAMMRAMDVLAHPSYREGLPRTVPQALLCGVCPIAYDADGTGEVCIDMQTGRLVPVADRAKLREAITWAAESPDLRAALAHRGREMCQELFSAERMVAELEKAYAAALTRARGTEPQYS